MMTSPYMPPNRNPPLPSHFDNACQMNMNNLMQPPVPVLHQPKLTMPTATVFSDMWKDVGGDIYGGLSVSDGYSADAAFDTLFEPLGLGAGYGVEGVVGYEYAEGMGIRMVG